MSQKILDALQSLDPANNNHWTEDGLPRLDTIKILAGDPSITRNAVTAAAPDFNRASAQGAAAGVPATPVQATTDGGAVAPAQAPSVADTVAPVAPVQGDEQDPPLTAPPMVEMVAGEELQILRDEAMARVSQCNSDLETARQALTNAQNELGYLEEKLAELHKDTSNPIMGYLESQKRVLEERAARNAMIKDSGLDLKALAQGLKSPLDGAMERRNQRGMNRPTGR